MRRRLGDLTATVFIVMVCHREIARHHVNPGEYAALDAAGTCPTVLAWNGSRFLPAVATSILRSAAWAQVADRARIAEDVAASEHRTNEGMRKVSVRLQRWVPNSGQTLLPANAADCRKRCHTLHLTSSLALQLLR